MKVIYQDEMIRFIDEAIEIANNDNRIIKHIELTWSEYIRLKEEAHTPYPIDPDTKFKGEEIGSYKGIMLVKGWS